MRLGSLRVSASNKVAPKATSRCFRTALLSHLNSLPLYTYNRKLRCMHAFSSIAVPKSHDPIDKDPDSIHNYLILMNNFIKAATIPSNPLTNAITTEIRSRCDDYMLLKLDALSKDVIEPGRRTPHRRHQISPAQLLVKVVSFDPSRIDSSNSQSTKNADQMVTLAKLSGPSVKFDPNKGVYLYHALRESDLDILFIMISALRDIADGAIEPSKSDYYRAMMLPEICSVASINSKPASAEAKLLAVVQLQLIFSRMRAQLHSLTSEKTTNYSASIAAIFKFLGCAVELSGDLQEVMRDTAPDALTVMLKVLNLTNASQRKTHIISLFTAYKRVLPADILVKLVSKLLEANEPNLCVALLNLIDSEKDLVFPQSPDNDPAANPRKDFMVDLIQALPMMHQSGSFVAKSTKWHVVAGRPSEPQVSKEISKAMSFIDAGKWAMYLKRNHNRTHVIIDVYKELVRRELFVEAKEVYDMYNLSGKVQPVQLAELAQRRAVIEKTFLQLPFSDDHVIVVDSMSTLRLMAKTLGLGSYSKGQQHGAVATESDQGDSVGEEGKSNSDNNNDDANASMEAKVAAIENVIGFDCEWSPSLQWEGAHVLQVATLRKVYIIDLARLGQQRNGYAIEVLARIFSSPSILKVQLSPADDLSQLTKSSNGFFKHVTADVRNTIALSQVVGIHDFLANSDPSTPPNINRAYSLKSLSERFIGKSLNKNQQVSDWKYRPLSNAQLEYAALDAHCLVYILGKLCRLSGTWKQEDIAKLPNKDFMRLAEKIIAIRNSPIGATIEDAIDSIRY